MKFYKVWDKVRSMKKSKTSIKWCRILQIALKEVENGNFAWGNFDRLKTALYIRELIKIILTRVYIKPEVKKKT